MAGTFDADLEQFRAIGHGALSLITAGFLLAILAVLLSAKSQTPNMITTALQFVTWLVAQVVAPIKPGIAVALTSTLAPASGVGTTTGSGTSSTATSTSATGSAGSIYDSTSTWDIPTQLGTTGTSPGTGGTSLPGTIPTMVITPGG